MQGQASKEIRWEKTKRQKDKKYKMANGKKEKIARYSKCHCAVLPYDAKNRRDLSQMTKGLKEKQPRCQDFLISKTSRYNVHR